MEYSNKKTKKNYICEGKNGLVFSKLYNIRCSKKDEYLFYCQK